MEYVVHLEGDGWELRSVELADDEAGAIDAAEFLLSEAARANIRSRYCNIHAAPGHYREAIPGKTYEWP